MYTCRSSKVGLGQRFQSLHLPPPRLKCGASPRGSPDLSSHSFAPFCFHQHRGSFFAARWPAVWKTLLQDSRRIASEPVCTGRELFLLPIQGRQRERAISFAWTVVFLSAAWQGFIRSGSSGALQQSDPESDRGFRVLISFCLRRPREIHATANTHQSVSRRLTAGGSFSFQRRAERLSQTISCKRTPSDLVRAGELLLPLLLLKLRCSLCLGQQSPH